MRLDLMRLLRTAWALARRDHAVLLPIAGVFTLVPQLALLLLLPQPPALPADRSSEAASLAWIGSLAEWGRDAGPWVLAGYAATMLGVLTVLALYLDPRRPDVNGALRIAGGLWPRALLASLLLAVPVGLGFLLLVLPGLYVMARTMLTLPTIVAERPIGAVGAIGESVRRTRGLGLPLTALNGLLLFGGQLLASLFAVPEGGAGPLTTALLALFAGAVAAAVMLAQALVQVALFHGLSAPPRR